MARTSDRAEQADHPNVPSTGTRRPMLIGYARVSTEEQNLGLQLDALKSAGCEQIFTDKISGTRTTRPGLDKAIEYMREGDTLTVWKLDRLGRSVKNLVDLVAELKANGRQFRSLTDGIDTSTTAGQFFFHVMAALSQMERDLIVERTRAGLAAAKRAGRTGGRPVIMTKAKLDAARKLLETGTPPRDVAEQLGISVPTLYRHLPAGKTT